MTIGILLSNFTKVNGKLPFYSQILRRNYRKRTILSSNFKKHLQENDSFVTFHCKEIWEPKTDCVIFQSMLKIDVL